jgi:hypothetical protein
MNAMHPRKFFFLVTCGAGAGFALASTPARPLNAGARRLADQLKSDVKRAQVVVVPTRRRCRMLAAARTPRLPLVLGLTARRSLR